MSSDPVAYVYETELHCPSCAEARFGRDADGWIAGGAVDSEGNPVGVVAPWDDAGDTPDHCGTCGAFLETGWTGETVGYVETAMRERVNDWLTGRASPPLPAAWVENFPFACDELGKRVLEVYQLAERLYVESGGVS